MIFFFYISRKGFLVLLGGHHLDACIPPTCQFREIAQVITHQRWSGNVTKGFDVRLVRYISWHVIKIMDIIYQDSLDHCPMLINANKNCGIDPNANEYRSLPVNANQFFSIPLNSDQCQIKDNWSGIDWQFLLMVYWCLDPALIALFGIDGNWEESISNDQHWLALGIDKGSPMARINHSREPTKTSLNCRDYSISMLLHNKRLLSISFTILVVPYIVSSTLHIWLEYNMIWV